MIGTDNAEHCPLKMFRISLLKTLQHGNHMKCRNSITVYSTLQHSIHLKNVILQCTAHSNTICLYISSPMLDCRAQCNAYIKHSTILSTMLYAQYYLQHIAIYVQHSAIYSTGLYTAQGYIQHRAIYSSVL
jgi:hypothetical protein